MATYWSNIKYFYNQYVLREDKIFFAAASLSYILPVFAMVVNWLTYNYQGYNYFPMSWLPFYPFVIVLIICGLYVRKPSPFISNFTLTYSYYYVLSIGFALLINQGQLTPFPPIDVYLIDVDKFFGFNSAAVMKWAAQYPGLIRFLKLSYDLIDMEIFAIPIVVSFFRDRWRSLECLTLLGLSWVTAFVIYYFFPTTAPASHINSLYFSAGEYATYVKFYQIRHYLPVTTWMGGLVAFPSCHVIWAIIFTYAVRKNWYLFIPILVINISGIASTVLLGWHYAVDVVGAFVVSLAYIFLLRYIKKKYLSYS